MGRDSGVLSVRRLFFLEFGLPYWVQKMFKTKMEGYAVEDVTCDIRNRKLVATGGNHTFSSFFKMEETISYEQHPECPHWTLYTQRMAFTVTGLGVLCGKLES